MIFVVSKLICSVIVRIFLQNFDQMDGLEIISTIYLSLFQETYMKGGIEKK